MTDKDTFLLMMKSQSLAIQIEEKKIDDYIYVTLISDTIDNKYLSGTETLHTVFIFDVSGKFFDCQLRNYC